VTGKTHHPSRLTFLSRFLDIEWLGGCPLPLICFALITIPGVRTSRPLLLAAHLQRQGGSPLPISDNDLDGVEPLKIEGRTAYIIELKIFPTNHMISKSA
jgi:hypothetical protein